MKPAGIFFATREGHTRRIANHLAAALQEAGLETDIRNLKTEKEPVDLTPYGSIILAASVHAGKHEREMVKFVRRHRAELETLPNAFLSATLSQVGAEDASRPASDRQRFAADAESVIALFTRQTGWKPEISKPVAGALLYSKYNFFIRWIMKRIALKTGAPTDTSRDYDFTNWADLNAFASRFAQQVQGRCAGQTATPLP